MQLTMDCHHRQQTFAKHQLYTKSSTHAAQNLGKRNPRYILFPRWVNWIWMTLKISFTGLYESTFLINVSSETGGSIKDFRSSQPRIAKEPFHQPFPIGWFFKEVYCNLKHVLIISLKENIVFVKFFEISFASDILVSFTEFLWQGISTSFSIGV